MNAKATPRVLVPLLRAADEIVREIKGGTAIEYGLIAAFIVVTVIGVMPNVMNALVNLPLAALLSAFANALS